MRLSHFLSAITSFETQASSFEILKSDMEEVCKIFPLIGEKIVKELDHQSLTKFKMTSKEVCEFLDNERVLWKQMILKNTKGKDIQLRSNQTAPLLSKYY